MKRLLLYIFILLLPSFHFSLVYAQQASDSGEKIDFSQADSAFNANDYALACSLYIDVNYKVLDQYKANSSQKIENLQKEYSIEELRLQKDIANNEFMRVFVIALSSLVIIFALSVIYIRHQNRRLKRTRKELEEVKIRTEESIRNKSLFLSNMSHEIKTPLNALSGFAEVLTTDNIDESTRKQCNDIIQLNSELLLKLLNDVVDMSCADVESMKFSIRDCEIISLSKNVVKMVSVINQSSASILFSSEIDSLIIPTDADRLKQMLVNLLVNATKFTKEGSITLDIKIDKNDMVQFSVSDTGCGIAPENRDKIFNRFEKLNEKAQGTGLGLSICKLIINRLGGDIWIDPDYTDGSRFVFVHPQTQKE